MPMKKVVIYHLYTELVQIDADSDEEAITRVAQGEGKAREVNYAETLKPNDERFPWFVDTEVGEEYQSQQWVQQTDTMTCYSSSGDWKNCEEE